MSTVSFPRKPRVIDYPTSDGRPMAETDHHSNLMLDLIETLKIRYEPHSRVYVSGNLLVFYETGNKRRHLAPDVFVVRDVPKHEREHYLIWEEGKGPEAVIELTSKSTRDEDVTEKFTLYQDTLKVYEYFLCDPYGDYLAPPLKGYRLIDGKYVRIEPVDGRLPSEVLGLHLEQDGQNLRLYDPVTGKWLPTPAELRAQLWESRAEAEAARAQAEARKREAELARQQAEAKEQQAETARRQAEAEAERLRRELDELQRRSADNSGSH